MPSRIKMVERRPSMTNQGKLHSFSLLPLLTTRLLCLPSNTQEANLGKGLPVLSPEEAALMRRRAWLLLPLPLVRPVPCWSSCAWLWPAQPP